MNQISRSQFNKLKVSKIKEMMPLKLTWEGEVFGILVKSIIETPAKPKDKPFAFSLKHP